MISKFLALSLADRHVFLRLLGFMFMLCSLLCLGDTQLAHAGPGPFDPPEPSAAKVAYGVHTSNAKAKVHLTAWAIQTFAADDCAPTQSLLDSGLVLQVPVKGDLSQPFGQQHAGVDWAGYVGQRIQAAHDGEVIFAGWNNDGYGYLVTVLYAPVDVAASASNIVAMKTHYAHLSRMNVVLGTQVKTGQVIGEMGTTGNAVGPHLHFEVRLNSVAVNPMCFFASGDTRQD